MLTSVFQIQCKCGVGCQFLFAPTSNLLYARGWRLDRVGKIDISAGKIDIDNGRAKKMF